MNNGLLYRGVRGKVSDLIDDDCRDGKTMRMGLRKDKLTLGGLLQNNSGNSAQDSDTYNDSDGADEKADGSAEEESS